MKFPEGWPHLDWLLKAFNDKGVEYLVIGSVARSHYRDVDRVDDLDLLVNPTLENSERAVCAIHEVYERILSGGIKKIDPKFFAKPLAMLRKSPHLYADILTPVESFSFFVAFSRSIETQVCGDIRAKIASECDLDVLDELREQSERDEKQSDPGGHS